MERTKNILGASALILLGAFVMYSSNNASAYQGNANVKGPNYTQERHAAMEEAFDNNDYNAWKALMQGRGRVTEVINEGNFARFVEMHELMEAGKTAEANAIRTELGLGLGNGQGGGRGMGGGRGLRSGQGGCNRVAQ